MGRLSRKQVMYREKDSIEGLLQMFKKSIFTLDNLSTGLDALKDEDILLKTTSLTDFTDFLIESSLLTSVGFDLPYRSTYRFVYGPLLLDQLALSLRRRSYLSHYSALDFHHLTNNVIKKIYTNVEQSAKPQYGTREALEQKNIDLAFSRPMRETRQIAQMLLKKDLIVQVYLLNGKQQSRIGVTEMEIEGRVVPVTSIERTLIDVVVRPNYAGGIYEVLSAFEQAKGRFSVNRLLAMLKQMGFTYPYHQLIGLYLEKAGYPESALKLFKQFEFQYDMYLTYQIQDKEYSTRWRVYYPKGF